MSDSYIQHREPRIGEIQARNSVAASLWEARRRPQGDGYNYRDRSRTTVRAASATIAARSSADDVEPVE